MQVLRQAQQHGATAGQELAQLRLQLHLEEAKAIRDVRNVLDLGNAKSYML